MKKSEYFAKIREGLSILSSEEIEKVLTNVEKTIENQRKDNQTEEEIIKNLDSVEKVIESTLKKHGINLQAIPQDKSSFQKKFSKLFESIGKTVEIMSKNDLKSNLKIVMDLLTLIVLICLIKIPFILVRYLGESLIQYFKMPVLLDIWGFVIEIVYLIVAIMVFMNVFMKWFQNLKVNSKGKNPIYKKEELPKMGEELSSISLTNDPKKESVANESENK